MFVQNAPQAPIFLVRENHLPCCGSRANFKTLNRPKDSFHLTAHSLFFGICNFGHRHNIPLIFQNSAHPLHIISKLCTSSHKHFITLHTITPIWFALGQLRATKISHTPFQYSAHCIQIISKLCTTPQNHFKTLHTPAKSFQNLVHGNFWHLPQNVFRTLYASLQIFQNSARLTGFISKLCTPHWIYFKTLHTLLMPLEGRLELMEVLLCPMVNILAKERVASAVYLS